MTLTTEIIRKKRDNHVLSKEEIKEFIDGILNGTISKEQISAFTMAVFFNGLNDDERKNLTLSMRDSGSILHFPELEGRPIVDKHSTGGVGDLVSLPLAAIVASCGGYLPMITGKGLGHTGGTTDKLSSIPGYNLLPDITTFKKVVKKTGLGIIGQTAELAPADAKIYQIRDITATVESIPLIASSILSKKLASGINNLVMDIKTGNGAFMSKLEDAQDLAKTIVSIAKSCDVPTRALITDMSDTLAKNIGNSLEIVETIEYLKGNVKSEKLHSVTTSLAKEMLKITNIAANDSEAEAKIAKAISSGDAMARFDEMVYMLGGPKDLSGNYNKFLPKAPKVKDIYLNKKGYISSVKARELGLCLVKLGGGRKLADDTLDLSVGLENVKQLGEHIDNNTPYCQLHYHDDAQLNEIESVLNNIIDVSDKKVENTKIIYDVIE